MSVKLSDLKVPENAPKFFQELIQFHMDTGIVGVVTCGVAALYWRKMGDDWGKRLDVVQETDGFNPLLPDCPVGREIDTCVEEQENCYEQADLWQRAAFEGVEP